VGGDQGVSTLDKGKLQLSQASGAYGLGESGWGTSDRCWRGAGKIGRKDGEEGRRERAQVGRRITEAEWVRWKSRRGLETVEEIEAIL